MEMPRTTTYTEEQSILRARQAGELSSEDSLRELYDLYGRSVFSWLLVRVPRDQAEDLFQEDLEAQVELGRCLDLAARICATEEIEVLVARLAGLSGAEIAQALGMSEAVVDHRYRDAIARLRRRLQSQGSKP